MQSNESERLPSIVIYMERPLVTKLRDLAKENERSLSGETRLAIKKHLQTAVSAGV